MSNLGKKLDMSNRGLSLIAKFNKSNSRSGPLFNGTPCWQWLGSKDIEGYFSTVALVYIRLIVI